MGNRVSASLIGIVTLATFAAFLFLSSAVPADAARGGQSAGPASLAFSIIDLVNQRLCDRQKALGGRLFIPLISPSKCEQAPEPQTPTVTLSVSPESITAGESSTLTWSSTDAVSCEAFLGWNDTKGLSGSEVVSPIVTTTYQLDCTGPGGVGSDDATVTVVVEEPDAPTVDITAEPMTITAGASSTLTWNSENADSCTASNGWSGTKDPDGTQVVTPAVTTTYAIECTGDGGTAQGSVTVTVNAAEPETGTLIVKKVIIRDNGNTAATTTFSFQVDGGAATAFEADGENSMTVDVGTHSVAESAVTGWTTTLNNCTDVVVSDGETETCTITNNDVAPDEPTLSFTASRTTVNEGSAGEATSTLTWDSTNATTCEASNGWSGTKTPDGNQLVEPTGTTSITYTLECTGDGGSVTESLTLTVVPAAVQPTLMFTGNPLTVHEGSVSDATTTLMWDSANTDTCVASGATEWTGSKGLDGSEVVTPTTDTTYELDCSGPGGDIHAEVVVDFVPIVPVEGELLITEVLYDTGDGQGTEPGNEWVELFNGTNSAIDFSGYYIHDASTSDPLPSVILPAGKFALITGSSTTASLYPGMPVDTVILLLPNTTIGNQLNNPGDFVWLESVASTTVDTISWGTNTSAFNPSVPVVAAPGHSLARSSNTLDTDTASDWIDRVTPNPGQ